MFGISQGIYILKSHFTQIRQKKSYLPSFFSYKIYVQYMEVNETYLIIKTNETKTTGRKMRY